MSVENPFASPSTTSHSESARAIDFLAVGLWLAIPIGVFIGQQLVLPYIENFGTPVSTFTKYLFDFYSPYLFASVSIAMVLAIFFIRHNRVRRRIVWFACVLGSLTVVACSLSLLVPLSSVWWNLN